MKKKTESAREYMARLQQKLEDAQEQKHERQAALQQKLEDVREQSHERQLAVQQRLEDIREQSRENLLHVQQKLEDAREQNIEDLHSSRKSDDTDDLVDKYFHEPMALYLTRLFIRLDFSPNTVTLLSMLFGVSGGLLFYPQNRWLNLLGVLLQIFAAILDCSDGQVARMTGKKSELGRVLDGIVDGLNFAAVYAALGFRMMREAIPFTGGVLWGLWIWPVLLFCGVVSHSSQARMADYYRIVHLFFKSGKDLARSSEIREELQASRESREWWSAGWQRFYLEYTKMQERSTPKLQRLLSAICDNEGTIPYGADTAYTEQSHKIIQMTNLLTFSLRAYLLYILVLTGQHAFYFPFVILVMGLMKHDMIRRYERIAEDVYTRFFLTEDGE